MINIPKTVLLVLVHIIAIKNVKKVRKSSFRMNFVLLVLFGVGLVGGYHRLYTHASYDAPLAVRMIFLLLGSASLEGDAIHWCSNHRMHHRYENTDKTLDPYSIQRYCNEDCKIICRKPHMILNFLNAHILWFLHKETDRYIYEKSRVIKEMKNNEWKKDNDILLFQKKYYFIISILLSIIIPIGISRKYFNDPWDSAIGAALSRIVFVWQGTFCVNSLCHLIGRRGDNKYTATNNHILSILTMGGGYHNYHHQYPKDYYGSKNLRCFNLTGWILRLLNEVHLINSTRRAVKGMPGKYEYKK